MKVMRVTEVLKDGKYDRGRGISSAKFRSYATRLFLVISVATLSACSTGSLFDSDTPVPTNYVLSPAPAASETTSAAPADISVSRPDLAPGLDSDRIAVLRGRLLDYYRG